VTAGKQLQQQQVKLFNCELAWAKKLKSGKQAENVAAVKTLAEKEVFFSLAKFHISLFRSLLLGYIYPFISGC